MGENESVRKLADLKSFLESKARSLESDLNKTREIISLVDTLLADRSFKRVEPTMKVDEAAVKEVSKSPLTTVDGVKLADFIVEEQTIKVEPSPELKLEASSPPLSSFLINRVLEPIKKKELDSVRKGEKNEEEAFSYKILQEGDNLKAVMVSNFGDERRMMELKSAIKWTFRRMYERSIGKSS